MKTNKDILISYYSGNIYDSECKGSINLEAFIEKHKHPHENTLKTLIAIGLAVESGNMMRKRELKHMLFAFTPTVNILKGNKRNYDNIDHWTGLMQLDFDGIETLDEAIQIKHHLFQNNKEIVCSYLSPSGKGVKCLMRIEKPKTIDHYRAMHIAMTNEFDSYDCLDHATKNAVLPLFLSADPNILYRDFSECKEWTKVDSTIVDYVHLNNEPTNNFKQRENFSDSQSKYFYNKVVTIVSNRINNINSDGHPQVRTTSLILGSRVGAGYINRLDAENLIYSLIKNNNYLKKGIKGYLSTAEWGISEGIKSPKYF